MEGNSEVQEPKAQKSGAPEQIKDMAHERLGPETGTLGIEAQTMEAEGKSWAGRLKDRLNSVLNKERVGKPRLSLDIFYSPHRSPEDNRGLEEKLQNADIYIPEVFGWTQDYLEGLRELSNGDLAPHSQSLFKSIYNKHKLITVIDLPAGHPLVERIKNLNFPKIKLGTDFDQYLDSVRLYTKEFAAMQQEREAYMLKHLQPKVQELIDTNPELQRKQEINILLGIGGAHTQLFHELKKDYPTKRTFSETPMTFHYREEAFRRAMFGKSIDDDLVVRVVAENLISKTHASRFVTNDSTKNAKSIREQVSSASFERLKKMIKTAGESQGVGKSMPEQGTNEVQKVPAAAKQPLQKIA